MKNKSISIAITIVLLSITSLPIIYAQTDADILQQQQNSTICTNELLFNRYITLLMKLAHKPSLAACIIKDDTMIWSQGHGYANIDAEKKATTHTLYLSASVSKTVAATALMQLWEQGLFDLDDDVNNYLPFELRNPNHPDIPITFRMLLAHRSSLAGDNLHWFCLSYVPGDPDMPDFPDPWLQNYLTPTGNAYTPRIWSDLQPGEKLQYANIGYAVIGYLIELLSGEQFDDYCQNHIFIPLEMYNTSYRLKDLNISNIAVPYDFSKRQYLPHPHYGMYVIRPGASMRTSVEEFSHFLIAHMNKGVYKNTQILNEATVELMHSLHYPPSKIGWDYGLGWTIEDPLFSKKFIGHSGGWPGVHTLIGFHPEDNTGIILFTNGMSPTLSPTHVERFAFSLLQKAIWRHAS